jgi:energy-coupling factor transporter ATP-binding protein EcfA2
MASRLKYLRVDEFRHVRPGSMVELGPQINVVVGRNGTGKTTLLELVAALMSNDFHRFAGERFALGFGLEDGEFSLEGTLVNTGDDGRGSLEMSAVLARGGESVKVDSDAKGSTFVIDGDVFHGRSATPVTETQTAPAGLISMVRLVFPRLADPYHDWQLDLMSKGFSEHDHPWTIIGCTRMTEGVETFEALFSQKTDHSKRAPTLGVTFIKFDREDVTAAVGHHIARQDLLAHLERESANSDSLTLDGTLAPLARFVQLSQYGDARLTMVKTSSKAENGVSRWTYAKPTLRLRTPNGNEIPHELLSFGEKRLLTFLIKLYAYPSTIIVDELANGMHHSWLEQCVELLEDLGTQAFLTSQNPLLLDCLPLNRETFAAAHGLVVCELADSGEMIWRNLGEREADDFFKSLEVGLQHVSEIMRSKGLW